MADAPPTVVVKTATKDARYNQRRRNRYYRRMFAEQVWTEPQIIDVLSEYWRVLASSEVSTTDAEEQRNNQIWRAVASESYKEQRKRISSSIARAMRKSNLGGVSVSSDGEFLYAPENVAKWAQKQPSDLIDRGFILAAERFFRWSRRSLLPHGRHEEAEQKAKLFEEQALQIMKAGNRSPEAWRPVHILQAMKRAKQHIPYCEQVALRKLGTLVRRLQKSG